MFPIFLGILKISTALWKWPLGFLNYPLLHWKNEHIVMELQIFLELYFSRTQIY